MADPKMLQFKMGEWTEGFDSMAKSAGTVYVTTNEKAMYVDVDDNTRIRIGDIIQLNRSRDAKPPFSTEALYYFIEENALLKWGPFGEGGAMAWKQLNSVSDITTNLDGLTNRVSTLETDMTTAKGDITDLENAVGTSTGITANADGTIYERILANKEAAAAAKAQADKGVSDAAKAQAKADANETAIGTLNTTVQGHATDLTSLDSRLDIAESEIDTLQSDLDAAEALLGTASDNNLKNTAFGRIAALEGLTEGHTELIEDLDTELGTLTTKVEGIETNVGTNASNISKNTAAIEALQTAVGTGADGLASKVTDLQTRMGTAESDIDTLQSDLDTAEGTIESQGNRISTLETFKTEHTAAYNTLNTTVGGHTTSIKNLQDANDALAARVKVNEDKLGSANPATGNAEGTVYERIKQNASDIAGLTNRTSTLETTVGKLTGTGADSIDGKIEAATTQLEEDLTDVINNKIIAANAMEYQDSVADLAALQALTNVKIGDTYIAANDFKLEDNTQVYAGDLLIANGTEGTDGFITGTITWDHVNTGYKVNQEQTLSSGENNTIQLKSYLGANNGTITFAAKENTSATVEVANNTVTIGIEWGTF